MATTAQQLLSFRKELLQGGLSPDEVREIIRDASQSLILNNGLVAAPLESTPPSAAPSKPLPPH